MQQEGEVRMKILIATDGSNFSQEAVDFAADIVSRPDTTEVKIISVIEPYAFNEIETLIESVEELADPSNAEARRTKVQAEQMVTAFKGKFTGTKINVSSEIIGGMAAPTIVEKAEDWGADLIVVGSHGHGFFNRAWLGSVSDRVVHHAPCAVLVVKTKSGQNGAL